MDQFRDKNFIFAHVLVCVAVFFLAFLLKERFEVNFSLLIAGMILSIVNVKIFSLLIASLLSGTRSKTAILSIGGGKIAIFFVIIFLLTSFSDRDLYSSLAGFFTFLPAACLYALLEQNK